MFAARSRLDRGDNRYCVDTAFNSVSIPCDTTLKSFRALTDCGLASTARFNCARSNAISSASPSTLPARLNSSRSASLSATVP